MSKSESSLNQEKKKGRLLLVVCLIVLMILCGGLGFLLGNGDLIVSKKTEEPAKKEEPESKEVKDGELAVDSEIVKELYSKVTDGELSDDQGSYRSCEKNWLYGTSDSGYKEEFDVSTALPEEKANFVFRNLEKSKGKVESCDNLNIPSRVDSFYSICSFNKEVNPIGEEVSYDVKYVEDIYHDLFGKNDKYNQDLVLKGQGNIVQFLNIGGRYYEYIRVGGSVCGPVKYIDKITKAVKENGTIKIYESEEYFEENVSKKKANFVYTFKNEDDSYIFVSRKKVS